MVLEWLKTLFRMVGKIGGTEMPTGKGVYDILGPAYTGAAGLAQVYDVQHHILATGGLGGAVTAGQTIVFDGGAGSGAVGKAELFYVTGDVLVNIFAKCTEDLVSAGGTISVGTENGAVDAMMPVTTATLIDNHKIWYDSSPTSYVASTDSAMRSYIVIDGDKIQADIVGANITDGTLIFYCIWTPLSSNGNVVVAV